jgi:drug/metabolite transporter (DMT)-like permease
MDARPDGRRAALDVPAMALLLGLCAIWGLGQVAIKIANPGVSPLYQAGIRSAVATLCLVAWAAARGVPLLRRDGTLGYGATIAAMFAAEFVFVYWGLAYTTASRAVLFIYTAPFVVALGAHVLLPGERLSRLKAAGLACAFAGLTLAFADGVRLPTRRELYGDTLELVGAILWGATTLVVKAQRRPISAHATLFYQVAGSAVVLFALAYASGEPGVTRATPLVLASLAYQGVVIAFASYLAWFWLLTRYPASQMHAFTFWTPLFGVGAGALLLREPVSGALAVAVGLVAAGIYLVNRQPRRPAPASAAPPR